ncbi:hypothetical protein F4860DRAFT_268900 [Xylaria cubensis]|nr:hypothetical protein F4860DRAFT_268900 [Xylaria cubensis]
MTREKKKAPAPAHGVAAAARRAKMERALQYSDTVWRNLNPLKAPPKMKHKSYFEAVENSDRKKKLEFEITTDREPPPGFEFIPTGHPELSQECKEQSRNKDAMFFIVSNSKDTLKLDHHMNRLGYHFRCSIVEEARKVLNEQGHHEQAAYVHEPGKPEPIPNSQREIDLEADAVLRDLFPRIPNTDRQEIIDHAFKKDGKFNGEIKVGMAKDITLARRVQLAALAHIRHTHTRYDELLRESDWANARKAVEKPCLDIIVKWRGDEETGRDQLDEILREVIEISDTETESEDEGSSANNARIHIPRTRSGAASISNRAVSRLSRIPYHQIGVDSRTSSPARASPLTPNRLRDLSRAERRTARKTQQRFKRYAAAAEALASSSNQNGQGSISEFVATPIEVVRRQGSAHPVNTYTTPSAVAHETYTPKTSYGHTEIQRVHFPHPNGVNYDRMAGLSYVPVDSRVHGGTEQFIRVPDSQRPKVGPYSANHNHPPPAPPLSPVRLGLQDLLLPSIEPRSPDGARVLPDASHRMYREGQQSTTEVPWVISRTIVEPAVPAYRPQSPGVIATNDEVATKRRRVTTHFPENFRGSPNSYVRTAPRNQDNILHRPQVEYLAGGHPQPSRLPEHVVYQDASWATPGQEVRVVRPDDRSNMLQAYTIPVTGDGRSPVVSRAPDRMAHPNNHQAPTHQEFSTNRIEAPLRSRANPIVIDGGHTYEPRRVIEVRGSPAHEIYRVASPGGRAIRNPHVQGEPRVRDLSRVVYIDESTDRLRGESSNQHYSAHQFQSAQPAYYETSRPMSPTMSLHPHPHYQSRVLDRSTRYTIPDNRNVTRVNELGRVSPAQPGPIPREIQVPLSEAPRPERFAGLGDHRPHSNIGIAQEAVPPRPRDNVIYREVRPDITMSPGVEYDRAPQRPFPVHPAPSSYVEIRGPLAHQRIPDQRDIIYVE